MNLGGLLVGLLSFASVAHGKRVRRAPQGANSPEQIHIAIGQTPDIMSIQWATKNIHLSQAKAHVVYGIHSDDLKTQVEGQSWLFTDSGPAKQSQLFHLAHLRGLEASTQYYYRVGSFRHGFSETYSFHTPPDARTLRCDLPLRFAVYGDMGLDLDGSTVLPNLNRHLDRDPAYLTSVLHVGDLAYDMHERNGAQGNEFMDQIQPLAARVSYLVDMGNHEQMYRFSHYTERFRNQPISDSQHIWSYHGAAPNNWWYSVNIGPVHLVTVSTEVYDYVPWVVERQYYWLEKDLMAANANRTKAPWIIVNGHKPIYCSSPSAALCDSWYMRQREGLYHGRYGMESLFYRYGVDLYLNGHQHNYERMYDVAPGGSSTQTTVDPPATTYIVVGNGGNREDNTPFEGGLPGRTAFRLPEWGYSIMEIHNTTHLYWEQRACDNHQDGGQKDDEDRVIDSFWLVQRQHGAFAGRAEGLSTKVTRGIRGGFGKFSNR